MLKRYICTTVVITCLLSPAIALADASQRLIIELRRHVDADMRARVLSPQRAFELKQQIWRIQDERTQLVTRNNGMMSEQDERYLLERERDLAMRIQAAERGH